MLEELLWQNHEGTKNLYLLNVKVRKDTTHIANSFEKGAKFWHERLGHLNMELYAMVDGMNLKEVPLHRICEGCVKGKHQSNEGFTTFRDCPHRYVGANEDYIACWSTILSHFH
jgi:hypothetical protein